MKRKIKIKGREIEYNLRKMKRAKNLRMVICCDGSLSISMPKKVPLFWLEKIILEKGDWIMKKIDEMVGSGEKSAYQSNQDEYLRVKDEALSFLEQKVKQFNEFYGFEYGLVSVRNQKTRWGSCSRSGRLSFNYKLLFLPEKIADYVVVHELCHLKEFNHSENFWRLVNQTIPSYREIRNELKNI